MLLVGVSALCCKQGRNYRSLLVSGVPLADGITEPSCVSRPIAPMVFGKL